MNFMDEYWDKPTMMYLFKQPLMIVGLLCVLLISAHVLADEEQALEEQSGNLPRNVEGLDLPESAESTIIPTNKATDIRVIIDISGSMKENDPENLRIPALNLIVEMIPDGARAGVWTFGQWVNMLIPPAIVDKQWRKTAKKSTQKINSHGLRTNMGEAMEKATWLFESGGEFEQHAILLTDGLVDIAPDSDPEQQQKNEAERQRISTDILKRYQDLGVKIHSIGLSENADKVLLEKLALTTNGSSVIVNNSEELVKAFLKAFEKSVPEAAEQVPLSNDNTFEIDENVEEFTALVFRKKNSPPMQLQTPSGKTISQIKGADNARWFGESIYDLVTVTKPEKGTWKIDAELDPDNRITVISDLKMDIKNLPNALFPGQQIDFEVILHEKGKVITNPDFLKLMTIQMTMTAESGRSGTKVISDPDNPPKDGRYKESISRLSKEGQYELKIEVDGKTFKRLRKDYIQVRQPIGFEIRKSKVGKQEAYAVRVIPQVADIEVSRTRVIAKLKGPDQSSIIQAMPWVEEGVWEAVIEPNKGAGEYQIAINIKGKIGKDQEFRVKPEPITLMFPIPDDFTHEYLAESEKQSVEISKEQAEEQATTEDVTDEKINSEEIINDVTETKSDEQATEQAPEMETVTEQEAVTPDLAEKMEEQDTIQDPEIVAPKTEDDVLTDEQKEALKPIPFWLYAAIPASVLLLGILGFLIFRKVASKKQGKAEPQEKSESPEQKADVSLNDGLDDEDFDDDFDLSGDDDEEMAIDISDEDLEPENDSSPLPDLDDLDEDEMNNLDGSTDSEPVADDIPDFDENFDVDNTDVKAENANAIDELDNVLDSLSDEDEEKIPQLEEAVGDEFDLSTDSDSNEGDSDALPEMEGTQVSSEDDSAIDEALANLESELDDIDVDALMDDEDKKEE